jgi:hypothetical protein
VQISKYANAKIVTTKLVMQEETMWRPAKISLWYDRFKSIAFRPIGCFHRLPAVICVITNNQKHWLTDLLPAVVGVITNNQKPWLTDLVWHFYLTAGGCACR